MDLEQWLRQNRITDPAFGKLLGASKQAVGRWRHKIARPRPEFLQRIYDVTNGEVTAMDFYSDCAEVPEVAAVAEETTAPVPRPAQPRGGDLDTSFDALLHETYRRFMTHGMVAARKEAGGGAATPTRGLELAARQADKLAEMFRRDAAEMRAADTT